MGRQKFNLKKFEKDRNKSYEGSKKGDYEFINHKDGRTDLTEIVSVMRMKLNDINCIHNNVGCNLPFVKRTLPQCNKCPMK